MVVKCHVIIFIENGILNTISNDLSNYVQPQNILMEKTTTNIHPLTTSSASEETVKNRSKPLRFVVVRS